MTLGALQLSWGLQSGGEGEGQHMRVTPLGAPAATMGDTGAHGSGGSWIKAARNVSTPKYVSASSPGPSNALSVEGLSPHRRVCVCVCVCVYV